MAINLIQDSYGKSAVRVAKITRFADYHEFKEVHVNIQLEGDFETVYREGDNTIVLPTDTMKNTIFALAKEHSLNTIEGFGLFLADYFLKNNPQVLKIRLDLTQINWQRMTLNGEGQPHSYIGGGSEKATAHIQATREIVKLQGGIKDLRILKTTDSGFENYIVDKFTTLPPTSDRILATEMETTWHYAPAPKEKALQEFDFQAIREKIRENLLISFANHHSLSVQHTLYEMGETVLKNVEPVSEISLTMPNLHYLLVNMKPFNMENKNEVFIASGDAFGYITGTLKRDNQLSELNNTPPSVFQEKISTCCGSKAWVQKMEALRPFQNQQDLFEKAAKAWFSCKKQDWLEAFTHHPRIGDTESLKKKFATTATWAAGEQGRVKEADDTVLQALKTYNDKYFDKFGFIFIVFATGKSAEDMLSILKERYENDLVEEIMNATLEQQKITQLRLEKLIL